MNGYTITGINQDTGAVYATFVLDDHTLNETVFVDDVTNADLIQQTLQDAYIKFQSDIETNNSIILPTQVSNLIGQTVDATQFEVSPMPPIVDTPPSV